MKTIKSNLKAEKLPEVLERSFKEFNIESKIQQNLMKNRYEQAIKESKIWTTEIYDSTNLIGSAVICIENFPFENKILKMSFLSQVIVQKEFRGLGYLKSIINAAAEIDHDLNCQASIVIARRAVGGMYNKYGYLGFGIFPEIKISKRTSMETNFTVTNNFIQKIDLLDDAYKSTYWQIPGSTVRSSARWTTIVNEIEQGLYDVIYEQSGADLSYAIIKKDTIIELSFTSEKILKKLISRQEIKTIKSFKIGANHPGFQYILELGGTYCIRPEPLEGHMIRPYNKHEQLRNFLKINSASSINKNKKNPSFSIEIPELCQW